MNLFIPQCALLCLYMLFCMLPFGNFYETRRQRDTKFSLEVHGLEPFFHYLNRNHAAQPAEHCTNTANIRVIQGCDAGQQSLTCTVAYAGLL